MALIYDNEIEEIRRKLLVDILILFGARDGLVERQVDFKGFVGSAVCDFGHRLTERFEVISLSLVGEDVSIYEEEDALLRS